MLTIRLRGRRSVPDGREISGQGLDRRALAHGQGLRLLLGEPLVVRLQPGCLGERGFPAGFQLPARRELGGRLFVTRLDVWPLMILLVEVRRTRQLGGHLPSAARTNTVPVLFRELSARRPDGPRLGWARRR